MEKTKDKKHNLKWEHLYRSLNNIYTYRSG